MKNYYALIHFGGPSVSGFLLLGYPDPEAARRGAIRELSKKIEELRLKYPTDGYFKVRRLVEFRRSFTKPWRRTKRGDAVLEMMELPETAVFSTGFWMNQVDDDTHLCNTPRQGREQPLGYMHSWLKGDTKHVATTGSAE